MEARLELLPWRRRTLETTEDTSTEQLIDRQKSLADEDDHNRRSSTPLSSENYWPRKKKRQGWRYGVACSAIASTVVLVINIMFAVTTAVTLRGRSDRWESGTAILLEGSSKSVHAWSIALHLIINGLSSIVLGASNYTMQCLCAPSREEIDQAHATGKSLDIGSPSIRNVFGKISWKRSTAWWILAMSSVPVHLFYNSAVFQTLNTNYYGIVVARDSFLSEQPFKSELATWAYSIPSDYGYLNHTGIYSSLRELQAFFAENLANSNSVQRLEPSDCIAAYAGQLVSEYSAALLVARDPSSSHNNSFLGFKTEGRNQYSVDWPCCGIFRDWDKFPYSQTCDVGQLRKQVATGENWNITVSHDLVEIDHCVLQRTSDRSKLQLSIPFLCIVIGCGFLKIGAMLWVAFGLEGKPLITMGDAVSSFLLHTPEDQVPSSMDIAFGPRSEKSWTPRFDIAKACHGRWFSSASQTRWCLSTTLCVAGIISGSVLLNIGTQNSSLDPPAMAFRKGFGKADTGMLLFNAENPNLPNTGAGGLIAALLLANSPQIICSFLYFVYNGLFTMLLLGCEWNQYFLRKKALRVSDPQGHQRSTYWLQLPYRYSVPLIVVSSLLHWFVSQSIFLVRIQTYNDTASFGPSFNFGPRDITSDVGYSCPPILAAVLLGVVLLAVLIGFSFRRLNPQMPVVRSNSLAIAAQCCRPYDDVDAAFLPVSWGEVSDEPGRLCFTSKEVHAPTTQALRTDE